MLKHNKMMVEITLKVILCKTISQITNNNSAIINKNACKKGVKFMPPFVSTLHIVHLKIPIIMVLIYISTLENHRKAGVGKSPNQSFLFI